MGTAKRRGSDADPSLPSATADESARAQMDQLIASGLVDESGSLTTLFGGSAEPSPAHVYTVEPDGRMFTTVRFATVRGHPLLAVYARPLARNYDKVGEELDALFAQHYRGPKGVIEVHRSGGEPELAGEIRRKGSAWTWRSCADTSDHSAKTLKQAFDALFRVLRAQHGSG